MEQHDFIGLREIAFMLSHYRRCSFFECKVCLLEYPRGKGVVHFGATIEHDGSLDTHHFRRVCEMIEAEVSQVVDIPYSDVNDHVVAATYQKYSPNFWDGLHLIQEAIDHGSLILSQLDKGNCFQVQTNGPQINVSMSAADGSRCLEILDAFVAGGWREANGGSNLIVG
jgi:hypothetical protein